MNYNQPIRNQMKIVWSGNELTSHPASPWRNICGLNKRASTSQEIRLAAKALFLLPIRFFTNLLSVSTVLVQVFLFYCAFDNSSSLNLAPVPPLHISIFVQNVPFLLPLIPLFDLLVYI